MSALGVYPVKSLRGLAVDRAHLQPWGFEGDRRWMVVDPDGQFITQRATPGMALVHTRLQRDGHVELTTAGSPPITLVPSGERVTVGIWRDTVGAVAGEPLADLWLSEVLGRPVRLVYLDRPEHAREIDQDYARPGEPVSFADGYPVLVTTTASLAALNAWQREADARVLPMDRFRPSIVVDTEQAWAEDGWDEITIGDPPDGVRLRLVKPCTRCVMTAVAPDRGTIERGGPLRQLGRHRPKVDFGVNGVPEAPGTVRVGDTVRVVSVLRPGARHRSVGRPGRQPTAG